MSFLTEYERIQTGIVAAYQVMEGLGATMPENETVDYLAATAATLGGGSGENGATFIPFVDSEGNLSWSNDKGLENPETVNIKGPMGTPGTQFTVDQTLILKDGILSVNTTNIAEEDNTLPITSAGVNVIVGNINALLKTI